MARYFRRLSSCYSLDPAGYNFAALSNVQIIAWLGVNFGLGFIGPNGVN
jgi:hypothetical protein